MIDNQGEIQVPEWIESYVPLLNAIHFTTQKYGEAGALKIVVKGGAKRYLRDLFHHFLVSRVFCYSEPIVLNKLLNIQARLA
jgi:hypothetical protein